MPSHSLNLLGLVSVPSPSNEIMELGDITKAGIFDAGFGEILCSPDFNLIHANLASQIPALDMTLPDHVALSFRDDIGLS